VKNLVLKYSNALLSFCRYLGQLKNSKKSWVNDGDFHRKQVETVSIGCDCDFFHPLD